MILVRDEISISTHPIVLSLYLSKLFVTKRRTKEDLPTPASPNKTTFTSRADSVICC
jgi:hypothetical protein